MIIRRKPFFMTGDKRQSGFSLIEMVTSLGIFSVAIVSMLAIFQSVVDGQRSAVASQNVQESMRYVFEVISKEVRNAAGGPAGAASTCDGGAAGPSIVPVNKVFNVNAADDQLFFTNSAGECVTYYLQGGRFMIDRDDTFYPITSDNIILQNLRFEIIDDIGGMIHSVHPRITVKVDAEYDIDKATHRQPVTFQTTISSRHYD